jgi:hypothetical protein
MFKTPLLVSSENFPRTRSFVHSLTHLVQTRRIRFTISTKRKRITWLVALTSIRFHVSALCTCTCSSGLKITGGPSNIYMLSIKSLSLHSTVRKAQWIRRLGLFQFHCRIYSECNERRSQVSYGCRDEFSCT